MYPWYRDSVAAAAAAGLGGPVGVVGSGFCSTGPGQGGTTIKTESGYSDCMLALDYVQSKVSTMIKIAKKSYRSVTAELGSLVAARSYVASRKILFGTGADSNAGRGNIFSAKLQFINTSL